MGQRVHIRSAFLAGLIFLLSPMAWADNQWLVGVWQMQEGPDGDEHVRIEFTDDGMAYSLTNENERQMPGSYRLSGEHVYVIFTWHGNSTSMELQAMPDGESLHIIAPRSGVSTIYTRYP